MEKQSEDQKCDKEFGLPESSQNESHCVYRSLHSISLD